MLTVLVRKKYLVDLAAGRKQRKCRRYGPRFNERVLHAGREVRFVCERRRLAAWVAGVVRAFAIASADKVDVGLAALREVYPTIVGEDLVAVIDLEITEASIKLSGSCQPKPEED